MLLVTVVSNLITIVVAVLLTFRTNKVVKNFMFLVDKVRDSLIKESCDSVSLEYEHLSLTGLAYELSVQIYMAMEVGCVNKKYLTDLLTNSPISCVDKESEAICMLTRIVDQVSAVSKRESRLLKSLGDIKNAKKTFQNL